MTIPKNEISPSPPLPGIRACLLGGNGRADAHDWCAQRRAGQEYVARISDWFFAWLPRYGHTATAYAQHRQELTVLVEGYISELAGRNLLPGEAAREILSLYQEHGLDFAGKIRGSFTILICDSMANAAYFISDRRRSRPMFSRYLEGGSVIFSPEIRELLRVGNALAPKLAADAVVEFVIFGASCNDHTIFSGIHAFPQAAILACHLSGITRNQYWKIGFSGQYEGRGEASLLDECDALIQQAVRRTLRETRDPFLFLSGGVDSRVILGSLLEQGAPLPVVIYGTEEGDDLHTASEISHGLHLEALKYQSSLENMQYYFEAATLDADCRAEVIDSPMASQLHRILGSRFGTFMNGDECFGWHKRSVVDGAQLKSSDAIDAIGLRRLDNVGRLLDWLAPRVRAHAEKHMDNIIDTLSERPGMRHPADRMDAMYYEQRMGNMLNAFTAQRLRFMEQARPFLDEDVIDFVAKLPARYRYNKYLLRRLLGVRYPNLMKVPLATKDSIPMAGTFRRLFTTDTKVRDYVSSHLLTGLDDRLSDLLELERFHGFVRALLDGAPLPAVRIPFWVHIPGFYRFYRVTNDVNPVNLVLRILQLNIYLTKTR